MKIKNLISCAFLVFSGLYANSQNKTAEVDFNISVAEEIKNSFEQDGRLYIYFSRSDRNEPRFGSGISVGSEVFAKNVENWSGEKELKTVSDGWTKTAGWDLKHVPQGTYFVQAVWSQNMDEESRINVPGNLYSDPVKVYITEDTEIPLSLSNLIPERELEDHKLVKMFSMQSDVLSEFWDKPMHLKASVLLPSGYENDPGKTYPVRYNVGGYGARYTRVNQLVNNDEFMSWWNSEDAPQVITVFLDGEGPFGDSYQIDSDNNGPFGEALINELIPQIEEKFRISGSSEDRFVDGCSTGGWVSLALQLYYPESFNGCWSFSPDAVSFDKMQLINIYEDENAFYNEHLYLRPSKRDLYGEPEFSIEQEVYSENVQGYTNSYITSGGQWGGWNAVYSPKGEDGLPKPIFDPITGKIDKEVARHWEEYDLLKYTRDNWEELGPKVQGKIYVWMGDMDNYYLNNALRDYDDYLETTTNPKSDAEIEFEAMKQHCEDYSHRLVLEMIWEKINSEE